MYAGVVHVFHAGNHATVDKIGIRRSRVGNANRFSQRLLLSMMVSIDKDRKRIYMSTPHSRLSAVRTAASTSSTSTVGLWAGGPAASR